MQTLQHLNGKSDEESLVPYDEYEDIRPKMDLWEWL